MLKKIKPLMYKYAILAAFVSFLLIDILILGLGKLLSPLTETLAMSYFAQSVLMIVPVAIVFLFGFGKTFKKGSFSRGLYCGLPFILVQLFTLTTILFGAIENPEATWKPWYLIIYSVFSIIGVGIREECIYRATLQNIVARKYANSVKGIWITAIVGSFIFGVTHFSNLLSGVNPISVIVQVINAAFLGLLFSAIYLRSGSIWAVIFIHTLTDIVSLAQSVFFNSTQNSDLNRISWSWMMLVFWAGYVGLSVFLLRPSKCKQICESLCFADEKSDEAPNT
jgi:membrane protease YdiL (CAAX protease family)